MNTNENTPPEEELASPAQINPKEILDFLLGSARRHLLLCLVVALLVVGIGLTLISAIPRKYESTSKVYASSVGYITSELTSGRRSRGDEVALKDIYESVYNHANLTALIHDAKLAERWPLSRNWVQQSVDKVRAIVRGPTSPEDLETMFLPMLANMIAVRAEDNASIRFHVTWFDPETAQILTQLVQRNYIASKEVEELSAITRATTVLEDELTRADAAFQPAVTELQTQMDKLRQEAKGRVPQSARPAVAVAAIELSPTRPATSSLELTAKLNEIRDQERAVLEPWQRRSAELKFQLADLLAVYGPAHPTVMQLQSKLKAAAAEPVELIDLRQREMELKASIASWAVGGRTSSLGARPSAGGQGESDSLRSLMASVPDDTRLAPARIQLDAALRKSQEMQGRLDAARMELAIARVGFKYRYREIEPARFWGAPVSPKIPGMAAGVVFAALLLGFLAGTARELIAGKVLAPWQVRQLGIEVFATVDVSSWGTPASDEGQGDPPPRA
jgi:uncharacterized protein involved in exopolysaccharide biosynthesis